MILDANGGNTLHAASDADRPGNGRSSRFEFDFFDVIYIFYHTEAAISALKDPVVASKTVSTITMTRLKILISPYLTPPDPKLWEYIAALLQLSELRAKLAKEIQMPQLLGANPRQVQLAEMLLSCSEIATKYLL